MEIPNGKVVDSEYGTLSTLLLCMFVCVCLCVVCVFVHLCAMCESEGCVCLCGIVYMSVCSEGEALGL